jgi:hypothetical protein
MEFWGWWRYEREREANRVRMEQVGTKRLEQERRVGLKYL